jgi:hypothetical protein
MAEAIEQHDQQEAVIQADYEERCRKWKEEEGAEEKEERETQDTPPWAKRALNRLGGKIA